MLDPSSPSEIVMLQNIKPSHAAFPLRHKPKSISERDVNKMMGANEPWIYYTKS